MAIHFPSVVCKFPELFETFWQVIFPHVIQKLARHTATPKTRNHKLPLKSGFYKTSPKKNSPWNHFKSMVVSNVPLFSVGSVGYIIPQLAAYSSPQFLPTKKHLFSARSSKMEPVCLRPRNGSKKVNLKFPNLLICFFARGVFATGWWFQPIWKILVTMGIFPK